MYLTLEVYASTAPELQNAIANVVRGGELISVVPNMLEFGKFWLVVKR